MELKKEILLNNKVINIINIDGMDSYFELINLLFAKVEKRFTAKISRDHIKGTIYGELRFNHNENKYIYKYYFENVESQILF